MGPSTGEHEQEAKNTTTAEGSVRNTCTPARVQLAAAGGGRPRCTCRGRRSAVVQGCAAGGGCDTVLTSRWATLLGLPTAFWGLLAYIGLAAIAFVRRVDRHWAYARTAAFFGVCYSVYLTVVSLTILGSACPYCLTSLGLCWREGGAA